MLLESDVAKIFPNADVVNNVGMLLNCLLGKKAIALLNGAVDKLFQKRVIAQAKVEKLFAQRTLMLLY